MCIDTTTCDSSLRQLAARVLECVPIHRLKGEQSASSVCLRWLERHRYWHTSGHLLSLLKHFEDTSRGQDRDVLMLAALYHDAVYNPTRSDNEEASVKLLLEHAADRNDPVIVRSAQLIEASKWVRPPEDSLTRQFWEADCAPLAPDYPVGRRVEYELAIFREYQFAPWPTYQAKRAEFLKAWALRFPEHKAGVDVCLELLASLSPRIAVYPGSFNPFHHGHLSILRQAERVFDKVIIGVAINRQKQGAAASLELRRSELQSRLCFHEVAEISGLLTTFVESFSCPLSVVRGVRDGTDLEAELRYSRFLDELRPGTNVVWIGCEAELQHLSSSAIRELESIESSAGQRYVPSSSDIYGLVQPP